MRLTIPYGNRPSLHYLHAAVIAALMVSACKRSDDAAERQTTAAEVTPSVPDLPDFAEFEEVALADPDPRPEMQLQVALDRAGFSPGVIDGSLNRSTRNALKGFQEAHGLTVTGELDDATRQAIAGSANVPATRVVRIPENWSQLKFTDVPEELPDQAKLEYLGYESLGEKLAERFHTTPEVLAALNPGGQPAGTATPGPSAASPGTQPAATPAPTSSLAVPEFKPGQLVRVPNVASAPIEAGSSDDETWRETLASLSAAADQPKAARLVADKSESWLKAYDGAGKLLAIFTVTSGSGHDPLPLGDWGITGVSHNPPFNFDPDLFWDVPDSHAEQRIPPGPNGPVGVVWIDLTKEHYGIHGTPEPQNIGVTQSHGCVRLTNWDAARLAQMVDPSTKVVFQA